MTTVVLCVALTGALRRLQNRAPAFFLSPTRPWKTVETTVFWAGEPPSPGDPGNLRSDWDRSGISTRCTRIRSTSRCLTMTSKQGTPRPKHQVSSPGFVTLLCGTARAFSKAGGQRSDTTGGSVTPSGPMLVLTIPMTSITFSDRSDQSRIRVMTRLWMSAPPSEIISACQAWIQWTGALSRVRLPARG